MYDKLEEIMVQAVKIASGIGSKSISSKLEKINNNAKTSRQTKRNKKQVEWWDAECIEITKNRKEALKIWKKDKNDNNFKLYKERYKIVRDKDILAKDSTKEEEDTQVKMPVRDKKYGERILMEQNY